MVEGFKRVSFQICKSNLSKEKTLLATIENFVEYATSQNKVGNPIMNDDYLFK